MHDREQGSSPSHAGGPSDELLLAAVGRAVLHRPPGRGGAPFWTLLEHLAIPRRSAASRALRSRLTTLEQRGWLTRASEHGVPVWALASDGARQLRRAERSARPPRLPESPQHLAWRRARTAAGQELGRFGEGLAGSLAQAERMLSATRAGAGGAPSSDTWFELGRRLLGDCRRVGSAWHCLHEWAEPEDSAPDLDGPDGAPGAKVPARLRSLRAGRRNVRLWDEPD